MAHWACIALVEPIPHEGAVASIVYPHILDEMGQAAARISEDSCLLLISQISLMLLDGHTSAASHLEFDTCVRCSEIPHDWERAMSLKHGDLISFRRVDSAPPSICTFPKQLAMRDQWLQESGIPRCPGFYDLMMDRDRWFLH